MPKITDLTAVMGKFKLKNGGSFIVLGLIAGVILIAVSFATSPGRADPAPPLSAETMAYDAASYASMLEGKLRRLAEGFAGISNVRVMVTLASSGERVYATKESSRDSPAAGGGVSRDSQREIALQSDGRSGTAPILTSEIPPKVAGVALVCRGASAETRLALTSLISAALGIPTNKIYVYCN